MFGGYYHYANLNQIMTLDCRENTFHWKSLFEDLTHSPTYTNLSVILPNAIGCLFEIYGNELKHDKQQSKT
jgi:hypothetical protein